MVPLCLSVLEKVRFPMGTLVGVRTDGVQADAIRVQGRPISGVQSCGEGAFGEMIVECSTRSQAKSEQRKQALAVVMGLPGILEIFQRPIHQLAAQQLDRRGDSSIKFPRPLSCHGLPLLCIYRT